MRTGRQPHENYRFSTRVDKVPRCIVNGYVEVANARRYFESAFTKYRYHPQIFSAILNENTSGLQWLRKRWIDDQSGRRFILYRDQGRCATDVSCALSRNLSAEQGAGGHKCHQQNWGMHADPFVNEVSCRNISGRNITNIQTRCSSESRCSAQCSLSGICQGDQRGRQHDEVLDDQPCSTGKVWKPVIGVSQRLRRASTFPVQPAPYRVNRISLKLQLNRWDRHRDGCWSPHYFAG
jgi:hypothetical protein